MRYQVSNSIFEGLQCSLDHAGHQPNGPRDPRHHVALIVLSVSLVALLGTGAYGLWTRDFVPVLVVWGVCGPVLALIVKTYIGPFDGWL